LVESDRDKESGTQLAGITRKWSIKLDTRNVEDGNVAARVGELGGEWRAGERRSAMV